MTDETRPGPLSEHPSAEELALHLEGLLDPAATERVRGHLATCDQCRVDVATLADLPALLAAAPAPALPPAVATRLERALAAEGAAPERAARVAAEDRASDEAAGRLAATAAAAAAAGPSAAEGPSQPTGVVPLRARRRWLSPAILGRAAAGVLLVGLAGTLGVQVLQSSGGDDSGGTTAASGGGESARESFRDDAGAGADEQATEAPAGPALTSGALTTASGRDYTAARLGADAADLLRTARPAAEGRTTSATLVTCLARLGGSGTPLAVDVASFEGQPATIVVLSGAAPDEVRVLAVAPDCDGTPDDLLAATTAPR